MQQINKWDEFKLKKSQIIETFIDLKKRSLRATWWLKIIYMVRCTKKIANSLHEEKRYRLEAVNSFFAATRTIVLYRRLLRRYGQDRLVSAHKNRIRYAFTFFAQMALQNEEGRVAMESKRAVKDFGDGISWVLMTWQMKNKTELFNRLVNFM